MAYLSPEYWRELKPKPAPTRPVFNPSACRYGREFVRVAALDFETDYDDKIPPHEFAAAIPPHEFAAAIRRFQRSVSATPYCAIERAPVRFWWQKLGRHVRGFWVCPGCYNRALPYAPGRWYAP